ncbi:MAG: phospholipid/cholesterol/gamma-HCH transport system substrate-binding protein [Mycobacterium sp.]|jgi:phospholipid/cholesterol/gamma-HCH transport system substrate-binding protein|nr:phospholipid/cholesterol/gamma-HCH transport system substrate-binding protein [Mycobacterium sp.]
MPAPLLNERTAPYKTAGLILLVISAVLLSLLVHQFRGGFISKTPLTMVSPRAGLVLEPGSKVTFNGVEIGKVARLDEISSGTTPNAKVTLDIESKYVNLIPKNVYAEVKATTVFGNKYVEFESPKNPSSQHISSTDVITAAAVTTEFNTLFETVLSISEKVDPIKLNQTLTAAAEALDGLGHRFGQSITHGNEILADLNPQMPTIRYDIQRVADLTDNYGDAAPDLFDGLENAVTTARTLNEQQANLDEALLASVGVGNTGADIFERGGPYLVRSTADLISTSEILDYNSPALYCSIRNFHDVEPRFSAALGGNGFSGTGFGTIMGAGNPYVYPDNLPRVNARGGPEGRPGCWQPITRDLWPAPYLVLDTGASIAPYNHFGLGQPILIEYVWGRQIGENTINP